MDEVEKLEVLRKLRTGRDALSEALAGVDDATAARKPSNGSWSILDCVEHVVATERYLLTRLEAATLADQAFEKWRREAKIAGLAADRTRKIEAPKQAHPHGRYATLGQALATFDAPRAGVVLWVQNCDGDLRCMMTDHMLIEGPVTCAEMLIMIAAHPARHAQQIVETRAKFGSSRIGQII
jgi:DinB superfamily